jgi:hypothetical protein
MRRGLLAVGLALGAGSQLGFSCQATCSGPYQPVGGDEESIGVPRTGDWPVPETAVARPAVTPAFDTDGDGTEDTVESTDQGHALVVHRSSGDLVLTVTAPQLVEGDSTSLVEAGDVDGDGRTDLTVIVAARASENATDRPPLAVYLVSGATPDGTHPVAATGALLLAFGDERLLAPAGDVDGDGRGDVAALVVPGEIPDETAVWRGADLTLTPGGTEAAPSLHPPAGAFLGAVPLDGRDALVIATHRADDAEPFHEFVVWVPEGGITFTTAGAGPIATVQPIGLGTARGQFRVLDDAGEDGTGHDVWLTALLQNRSNTQRWAWDLDDLCANSPVSA